eukprot:CAMPEP_0203997360 /NCGR_PEP_ID=MMETSP0360-20130528/13344_1 /ASSEMBLY_ACC=CAM_ASM_000342 /TAXON_ID=268821 /ORGANISM="Scrippsiella Hangoei, Strain SHTV-5" /LENGTH=136 /DNA_ID=CAMNT_0050938293 /DNA_START=35 /DNA_END=442 /DNA_ORIENTATION=-
MNMVQARTKATFQNGTASPPSPLVNVWADRAPIAKQANKRVPTQPTTSARHKSRRAICARVLGFSSGALVDAGALLGDTWLSAWMLCSLILERTSSSRNVTTISGSFSGMIPVRSSGTGSALVIARVARGCAAAAV